MPTEHHHRVPLLMEPAAVRKEWGGGPPVPGGRLGESWEVSDVPGRESTAISPSGGRYPFGLLVASHPRETAGDVPFLPPDGRFPLLVKYLHVGGFTSVQVHPGDREARELGEPHPGKSEAWVVVDAGPDAEALVGFAAPPDRDALPRLLASGRIVDCLNRFSPRVGDCIPVGAGTIHAIGGGVTVFEVQTNSQVTYRLFDWGRDRGEGLHLDRGIACLDTSVLPDPVPPPSALTAPWGRRTILFNGEAFAIERHTTTGGEMLDGGGRFLVVSSLGADGGVAFPGGSWPAAPGRTWFIPAAATGASLLPGGDYLVCFVPRGGR